MRRTRAFLANYRLLPRFLPERFGVSPKDPRCRELRDRPGWLPARVVRVRPPCGCSAREPRREPAECEAPCIPRASPGRRRDRRPAREVVLLVVLREGASPRRERYPEAEREEYLESAPRSERRSCRRSGVAASSCRVGRGAAPRGRCCCVRPPNSEMTRPAYELSRSTSRCDPPSSTRRLSRRCSFSASTRVCTETDKMRPTMIMVAMSDEPP